MEFTSGSVDHHHDPFVLSLHFKAIADVSPEADSGSATGTINITLHNKRMNH